jgi:hypothetical protein
MLSLRSYFARFGAYSMRFSHHQNGRNKQVLLLLAACIAFFSIIIASALAAPHSPPVVIVPTATTVVPTSTPPPPPVEHPLTPDAGYYGVYRFEGAGMGLVPVFFSPAPFKIVWRCEPTYGPHWLRMPVYQLHDEHGAHEESDVVNFTCDPNGLKQAHGKETYPPGTYGISVLSHVAQKWEILIETQTLDVPVAR